MCYKFGEEEFETIVDLSNNTNLRSFVCQQRGVLNLVRLPRCLVSLSLARCDVEDISPLKSLTHLRFLNLSENYIIDLQPLFYLIQLERLELYSYKDSRGFIKDVRPLQNLHNLIRLNLYYNRIESLDGLQQLFQLEYLNVSKNKL